jgi:NAD(P)-dependent dehydrogenase (short-subunit alcohol dehydrogenase family)
MIQNKPLLSMLFVITSHLLPLLLEKKNASSSRIVLASSIFQDEGIDGLDHWDDIHCLHQAFDSHKAYSESKSLDAMLSMDFAQRFLDAGISTDRVSCNCLDPGTVQTKMLRAGWGDYPGINVEEALGRDDVFGVLIYITNTIIDFIFFTK